MARSTFKTLFYLNRSKQKKNGKCPIMGRITIDGEQVQYSTGKETAPELWDSRKGRCKGAGEEAREINRYLQSKEEQTQVKYQELVWQRGYITAELLKRELMEEDTPKGFLMEEAHLFIEEKRPCVGVTVAKPTFANYIYATQLIQSYLRERWGWRTFATLCWTMALSRVWTSTSNQIATSPLPPFRLWSSFCGSSSASVSRRSTSASTRS